MNESGGGGGNMQYGGAIDGSAARRAEAPQSSYSRSCRSGGALMATDVRFLVVEVHLAAMHLMFLIGCLCCIA